MAPGSKPGAILFNYIFFDCIFTLNIIKSYKNVFEAFLMYFSPFPFSTHHNENVKHQCGAEIIKSNKIFSHYKFYKIDVSTKMNNYIYLKNDFQ